ncbi:Asp-tRNA(Asn)/Glu-tRNA(Gln) amidotransferase subunit GatB [Clostridiaceae bacterium NSJ-31]|uniref:Aspartyl/glutamyl-tRNA(Asn/Gln) amidotransferase subunit B n=1 Tax=Ligaoa zhengdingensis TaxID=2763658 RepID=A0A926DYE5_9FIRM|nr:Asp-tRNA(Asn)/Glu-tRNA(Gln) amidotransferase subunit GatB [Ligaoa zhengdingensis]MBC8545490.1 Asp-tRNA(Asn)/Glu-tRNA(Gln) amidotransferase subunit GatB [Ligaoa zhengdingensis]
MDYEMIVGLEVHAELKTKTKIYCGCKNEFGAEVNTNCCPICTGMPGTLPTLNEKVVEYAIKMGHATNCSINRICKQDRKNYFYPDLPKAYQISQFDIPLCEHGYLDCIVNENGDTKRIGITRIHIEEDAGKLIHDDSFAGSLVDFNRCGVPLIEIVSEPDIRSVVEAKAYLDTIKSILQYIDVSDCKMQEGSIRCDVNVSVHKPGEPFGTRVEMKNVNSFSGACRAIEYEANRQIEILEQGGEITQETRRWDDMKGCNFLLRSKEDAQDYRYFPEPDLLTIVVEQETVDRLKAELPELPNKKIKRYMEEYGLPHFDSNLLVENIATDRFFEQCIALGVCPPKAIANWLLGDVTRILHEKNIEITETSLTPEKLTDMIALITKGTISNTAGKTVLEEIIFSDKLPEDVVQEKGLAQVSDTSVLEEIAKSVLAANAKAVEDYKGGKTNVIGFLVGQCMRQSKGQGNPAVLKEIILKLIAAE